MKQIAVSPADVPYQLVNFGVDTLVLNIRYAPDANPEKELPEPLTECLNAWQALAKEQEEPTATPQIFRGAHLMIYPHGAGKGQWRWLLNCPDFKLYVSRGRLNGVVGQIRFDAKYLWSSEDATTHRQDIWPLIVEVSDFLSIFFTDGAGLMDLQVSEVHLCADVCGWDVSACDWQHSFLSLARTRVDRAEQATVAGGAGIAVIKGRRLATLDFGSHGSPLSCCIYNKSQEIKVSKKLWNEDIWKFYGWDGEAAVWRVEFRWKREALHEIKQEGVFHGIESIFDLSLPDRLSFLWTYCAGHIQSGEDGLPDGWLRYALPSDDTNIARWPVHPAWVVVQSAFTSSTEAAVNITTGEVLDLPVSPLAELIRKRHYEVNIQRLAQQIGGCASTLAAWLGQGDTLPFVLAWLMKRLPAYALPELAKAASSDELKRAYQQFFTENVDVKRDRYGLLFDQEEQAS